MAVLADIAPDAQDYGPIPEKTDRMSGVYMGNGVVLTTIWTGHIFMVSTSDMIVMPHLIRIGINEPHNTRTIVSLVKAGDVFVDIGANVGYFSLLAAWRSYPGGQIWSFEPNPKVYPLLSDNLHNNGFGNLARRHCLAISDQSGVASLRIFPGYEATSTLRELSPQFVEHTERETGRLSHTIAIEVVKLDDVMRDVPEIHVMKIDAEGHEPSVIRGAEQILRRSPNVKIVMEFVPPIMKEAEAADTLRLIRGMGFSIFSIEIDGTFTPRPSDVELLQIPFADLLLVRV